MIATLWIATSFALVAFIAALIRMLTLKVANTVGGRATLILLPAMILLAAVGILRRFGWEFWMEAQALAWFAAAGAALGAAFTRSHEHLPEERK